MVLQKRLSHGFYGYQFPPTPRAARSARRKKTEDNKVCSFDLLAIVAGNLLLDKSSVSILPNKDQFDILNTAIHEKKVKEEKEFLKVETQLSNFIRLDSALEETSPRHSVNSEDHLHLTLAVTTPDRDFESNDLNKNGCSMSDCKVEMDHSVVSKDDDENENSSVCTYPRINQRHYRPTTCIGDRRLRKIVSSRCWKLSPRYKEATRFHNDGVKNFHKHLKADKMYPFKKRKHVQCCANYPTESTDCLKLQDSGNASSSITAEKTSYQPRDSHVKIRIRSFKVPELFIEIPESETVSSLKRSVMDAVTAILGGGLRIGVLLKGKNIGDDDKTLLQTGISQHNHMDSVGFSLEPSHSRNGIAESDLSVEKSSSNSTEMIALPAMNVKALAVVPSHRKRAEFAQRRIRRPFTVTEVEALVQAVENLGTGRWRDVKLRAFDDANHRTYVDLKDKWKTLVHTARIAPQQRRGEPVPQELLDRVLSAHAYWSQQQEAKVERHHLHRQADMLLGSV